MRVFDSTRHPVAIKNENSFHIVIGNEEIQFSPIENTDEVDNWVFCVQIVGNLVRKPNRRSIGSSKF